MPTNNRRILIVLMLLALAVAVSRGLALTDSLWIDELHTSWVVSDSIGEIGERARLGNQQPLYFYLPWLSIQLFGHAEWSLRLPSYLAGIALIPAVFVLARWWLRSNLAAIAVAALAVLDRQWLSFGQEARVYSIIQLAAVGQFALVTLVLARPAWSRRLGLIALSAAMFYLHYTTALLALAGTVAAAVTIIRRSDCEYRWRDVTLDAIAYLLLTLPAWTHVFQVAQRRENWEAFVKLRHWSDPLFIFPLDVYVLAPLVVGGVLLAFQWSRDRSRADGDPVNEDSDKLDRSSIATFAACWLVLPLAIAWLTTRTDLARLFFHRYLIGAAAGGVLVAGLMIAMQKTTLARTVLTAAVIYLAAWRGGWLVAETYTTAIHSHANEQWREAIATIADRDPQGIMPVLIDAGLIETADWFNSEDPIRQAYCTLPVRGLYSLDDGNRTLIPYSQSAGGIDRSNEHVLKGRTHAWLILRRELRSSEHAFELESTQQFGSVWVYRITYTTLPAS